MPTYPRPTLEVFTLKEGLFARLGHDLRLSFERFEIEAEAGSVTVRVDLTSLRVDGAMGDGKLDTHALDASDREKIRANARDDVLNVARYPDAQFVGQAREAGAQRFTLSGSLTLHGATHPVEVSVRVHERELSAEASLVPSQWGIAPFRALAGTIRIRDLVRIEARLPLPEPLSTDSLLDKSLRFRGADAPAG